MTVVLATDIRLLRFLKCLLGFHLYGNWVKVSAEPLSKPGDKAVVCRHCFYCAKGQVETVKFYNLDLAQAELDDILRAQAQTKMEGGKR